MAGLLDGMFGGSAGQQGLLAGSMALLNAGGPSRMPISLGQALGQGFGAGQQAYQQAMKQKQAEQEAALLRQQREQEFALTKQYREAQIKKMQDDAAARGRMDTTLQGLLSGGASSPDALEKVGTTMLIGGDPRGSGLLSLAQQRRAAAERSGEMQSFTATGTTNQNPTPEEAAIPVQAGAAERFMGPEAAQIPGLQQRAMALGNFIQKNPGADPKVARAELAELDKMVTNYNAKMTTQNASAEREEQRRQDKLDAEQRNADLRRELRPQPPDQPPVQVMKDGKLIWTTRADAIGKEAAPSGGAARQSSTNERAITTALNLATRPIETQISAINSYYDVRQQDSAQAIMVAADLLRQSSKAGNVRFKGEADKLLGGGYGSGSLADRMENFLAQQFKGRPSKENLQKIDKLMGALQSATLDNLSEQTKKYAGQARGKGLDLKRTIGMPRPIGKTLIMPDGTRYDYPTEEHAMDAAEQWEKENQ
jgi:hypothetical protein